MTTALATVPTITTTDPWGAAITLATDRGNTAATRTAYRAALTRFQRTLNGRPVTRATVQAYKRSMLDAGRAPRTVNLSLTAIRAMVTEAGHAGGVDPTTVAGIVSVKGVPVRGVRTGRWLDVDGVRALVTAPDVSTVSGVRDRALLAVLVGTGLRRAECSRLAVSDIVQLEGRWVFADIVGKGRKVRTVPVPPWVKTAVDRWLDVSGVTDGPLFRTVNKGGRVGGGLSAAAVWKRVRRYTDLAPHDLRRTFARLAFNGGAALDQLALSLGHASVTTTERYVGARQELVDAPCDRLGVGNPWH